MSSVKAVGAEAITAFLLLPLIDTPWLVYQLSASQQLFSKIQGGRPVQMRLWPAVIVYIALAFLLLKQTSVFEAALSGSAVYAVYDFTKIHTIYLHGMKMNDTVRRRLILLKRESQNCRQ